MTQAALSGLGWLVSYTASPVMGSCARRGPVWLAQAPIEIYRAHMPPEGSRGGTGHLQQVRHRREHTYVSPLPSKSDSSSPASGIS